MNKFTPEQLIDFIKSELEQRRRNKHSDGTFHKWVNSALLSELTGWNKRKVRYEFDKLHGENLVERHRYQNGAYIMYSIKELPGCVRFGDYFKEA